MAPTGPPQSKRVKKAPPLEGPGSASG